MPAPLVAVVGFRVPPDVLKGWKAGAYAVPENYVRALRRAGATPAILPPGDSLCEEHLQRFDALLLVGGGDVDPERYGGDRHPSCQGMDPERDAFEIRVLHLADRAGLPTLAICRGAQVVNVAFGGTLIPHLPDVPGTMAHATGTRQSAWHEVKVVESSRLAEACGREELRVASRHHQGVDRLGEGLVPTAWSPDGLIEAVEREGTWMLGLQWHPETTAHEDSAQQALFDALITRARAESRGGWTA